MEIFKCYFLRVKMIVLPKIAKNFPLLQKSISSIPVPIKPAGRISEHFSSIEGVPIKPAGRITEHFSSIEGQPLTAPAIYHPRHNK